MKFTTVTGKDNPLVKQILKLQTSARARREAGLFVLEGLRICSDAVENGIRFEKLVVSESAVGKYAEKVGFFSDCADAAVQVTDSLFERIGDTDSPQGILALVKMPEMTALPDKKGRYIGLENLNDPSNLGAIARTAEALGVAGIVLTKGSCDPFSPKVLRASMGTLLRVPLYLTENMTEFAAKSGLRMIACVVDRDAQPIGSVDFGDGDLLLIGNEANGLLPSTRRDADLRVTIPMRGRAESFNAAAAAAIALWEMMR